MPISTYLRQLRALVGPRLLLLPAVAAIIRDADGQVLLMQQAEGGSWSLPAGAIDPGETPEAAVKREVAEETGLHVRTVRLVAAVGGTDFRSVYPNGDQVEYVVNVFACTVAPGALRAVDGEAASFQWVAPETVLDWIDLPYPATLF
ncbi:MAG: NUDIX domain-containing protein [Bacteroidota bacterium]